MAISTYPLPNLDASSQFNFGTEPQDELHWYALSVGPRHEKVVNLRGCHLLAMDGEPGRQYGLRLAGDYMEVHYEDLVQDPRSRLARIGKFIEHDLDYERIQRVALGSVRLPNSSFRADGRDIEAATVRRWKTMFGAPQLRDVEAILRRPALRNWLCA